jgi:hypothetical protein
MERCGGPAPDVVSRLSVRIFRHSFGSDAGQHAPSSASAELVSSRLQVRCTTFDNASSRLRGICHDVFAMLIHAPPMEKHDT